MIFHMGTVPLLTFVEFMWLSDSISLILSILSLGWILTRSHIRLPPPGSLPSFPQGLIRSLHSPILLHPTFLAICELGCIFHLALHNWRAGSLPYSLWELWSWLTARHIVNAQQICIELMYFPRGVYFTYGIKKKKRRGMCIEVAK